MSALYAHVAVPAPLSPLNKLLSYKIPHELLEKVCVGSLVEVPFRTKKIWGLVCEISPKIDFESAKAKNVSGLKLAEPCFDSERIEFVKWLSSHYLYPLGEAMECAIPAAVREASTKILSKPILSAVAPAPSASPLKLNAAQSEALKKISSRASGPLLLWGVTGSGKTEVYLRAIEEVILAGKSALMLVPEISLTPQLSARFEERFGNNVAIFHSNQKATKLRKAWLETLQGKRRIAVGARSALFAPLKNLGMIIVDEEHDSSYKQDDRLRYHARDAALKLAELYKIPVILGSATPSAETFFAAENGLCELCMLPDRAHGAAKLPRIEIVDLKKSLTLENKDPLAALSAPPPTLEPRVRGDFYFSDPLKSAMDEALALKQQVILFLNRRGLGSQIVCRACGTMPACPYCDIKLTPHRQQLLCHYCGYKEINGESCKSCRTEGGYFTLGLGTEAVEDATKVLFPKARVLRLDRDSTESPDDLNRIVEEFRAGNADILIGTQMVAKGHDFERVSCVGILLADLGLSLPDFRANERTFQLLLQVSGRAGRGLHPGRVFLQSFQPEHPVFEALRAFKSLDDYGNFLRNENSKRQTLGYPPCGNCVLLRFDGPQVDKVFAAAEAVQRALTKGSTKLFQALGPVPSPLSKLRGHYRYQLLLKGEKAAPLQKAAAWILESWHQNRLEAKFHTRLVSDVDPINML